MSTKSYAGDYADDGFPARFRSRRRRLGWTQADVARLSENTRTTVGNWENGRTRPHLGPGIMRVCGILRCRPDWLLWGVKEED